MYIAASHTAHVHDFSCTLLVLVMYYFLGYLTFKLKTLENFLNYSEFVQIREKRYKQVSIITIINKNRG